MSTKDVVYIVSACRTGIGAFQGQFSNISAAHLGASAISFCLKRISLSPRKISQVIMGQALAAGCGQNPAGWAAIGAGISEWVPAFTVNMHSGSSLKAVILAHEALCSRDANFVVCGGQENMSRAQHVAYIRGDNDGDVGGTMQDTIEVDGWLDPLTGLFFDELADRVAQAHGISQEDQDAFSQDSLVKASVASKENYFIHEVASVCDISKDEHVHACTTGDGRTRSIGDGAAALVLCRKEDVIDNDLVPFAKIISFAQAGADPLEAASATVEAIEKALRLAGWSKDAVDLFEINEDSAAHALVVMEELRLDPKKVNVSGGAIAFGNPLGAAGAKILVTLIFNLHRLNKDKGVVALGVGGGMGIAIAIERPNENLVI